MKAILTVALLTGLLTAALAQPAQVAQARKAAAVSDAPKLPAFVAAEEVKFAGDALQLMGTLFLPKNQTGKKVPAILMVSEFYATRDGIPALSVVHDSYRALAEYFTSKGLAVLRYDRRCTGASECNPNSTMAMAADDAVGAVRYLHGRKEIDASKVWILGHGDGSFIAASANAHKGVAGLITISAPGRNASKLVREWARKRLSDQNASDDEMKTYLARLEKLILKLTEGGHTAADYKEDLQDDLVAPLIKNADYAFSWLTDDPLAVFPSVEGATLIVHGGKDRRVPIREGIFIKEAMLVDGPKDVQAVVLPDMDYFMKQNKGEANAAADKDTARSLDPALLQLLDEWIAKKIK